MARTDAEYKQDIEKLEKKEKELKEQLTEQQRIVKNIDDSFWKQIVFKEKKGIATQTGASLANELSKIENDLTANRREYSNFQEAERLKEERKRAVEQALEEEKRGLEEIAKTFDSICRAIAKLSTKLVVYQKAPISGTAIQDSNLTAMIATIRQLDWLQNARDKIFNDRLQEITTWDSYQLATEIQLCQRNFDDLPNEVKDLNNSAVSIPTSYHLLVLERQFIEEYILRLNQVFQQITSK